MFRSEVRLLVVAVVFVFVVATGAQSQAPTPAKSGSTADQQARMRGLENELVELRRLVGQYQEQLAVVLVDDNRAREVARLQASEETAQKELTRVQELYQATRAELEGALNARIELQGQVARLARRVEDEPAERRELQQERERLTTQLVVLTEELRRERVRGDAEIERARQAAVTLEGQLRQVSAENERLQGRYLQTSESLATLQHGFRFIRADAESMRQRLRLAREREHKLEQQLAVMRNDRSATVENKELLAALTAAQNARREQIDEIARLRADLREVGKERDQFALAIKVAEAEKSALRQSEVETQGLMEKMRAQIEETISVRGELEKLQQQKEQFEIALSALRDQSGDQGKLVVALEKSNAARIEQEQQIGRLRSELATAVTTRKQLESALEAAGESQQKLQDRQERVQKALADVRSRLHQTLTETTATREQLAAARAAAAKGVEQTKRLKAEIEMKGAELAQARKQLKESNTREQDDVGRLEVALKQSAEEKTGLVATLQERTEERDALRQMLGSVRTELQQNVEKVGSLEVALKQSAEEKTGLVATLQERTKERDALRQMLGSVRTELQQNVEKIGSLEVALRVANVAKEALDTKLKGLETSANQTAAELARVEEKAREAARRASEQAKEVEQTRAELAAAVAARTALETSMESVSEEAANWRQRQQTAAAKLSEISAELAKLKDDKTALDGKLQVFSSEKQRLANAISSSYERALEELAPEIEDNAITVVEGPDRMTIRVGGAALFSPGDASLRAESRAMLDKVVTLVKEFPNYDVRAEGHTDSTGNWSANWQLSALRAGAVVRYLQEKGVKPERLASTGYAFYRPVASNDTPEGRAANRRIEISLEPKE